jgi:TrmH family RNA methyltransferase
MISIILIEPENAGNIGAIARVMKNFDVIDLILINPKCNHLDPEANIRAKHAKDILKKAKVKNFNYLKQFDYLIGTTAILGTDYNVPRTPLTPVELAETIRGNDGKIALVFGREGQGLRNKEIEICDFIVTIPTSKTYPTLNLSHSVAIILYELQKSDRIKEKIRFADKREKDILLKHIDKAIDGLNFATKEKKATQRYVWRRFVGKAMLTGREISALFGFFKKLQR